MIDLTRANPDIECRVTNFSKGRDTLYSEYFSLRSTGRVFALVKASPLFDERHVHGGHRIVRTSREQARAEESEKAKSDSGPATFPFRNFH
jgi:hypothetical protein